MKNALPIYFSLLLVFLAAPAFAFEGRVDTYRQKQAPVEIFMDTASDEMEPLRDVQLHQPLRLTPPAQVTREFLPDLTPPATLRLTPPVEPAVEKIQPIPLAAATSQAEPRRLAKPFFTAPAGVKAPESKKAEPKKAEPKKAEPKKAEPKKAEPKKAEPKKAEVKAEPPKKAEPKAEVLAVERTPEKSPVAPLAPAPAVDEQAAAPEPLKQAPAAAVPAHDDMAVIFDKGSSQITAQAEKQLGAIVTQMRDLPDMRLQIRAYATDGSDGQSGARRMSLSRGLMVRSYLTERGIQPIRLDVRALGSETDTLPVDRVDLVFVR